MPYIRTYQKPHPKYGTVILAEYQETALYYTIRAAVPKRNGHFTVRLDFDIEHNLKSYGCTCDQHQKRNYAHNNPYAACSHTLTVLELLAQNTQQLQQWQALLPKNPQYKQTSVPSKTRSLE